MLEVGFLDLTKCPPLAVGLFVEAEILGREAQDVVVVPRKGKRRVYKLPDCPAPAAPV